MSANLISSREACGLLATIGLAREQARLVLACGLAGQPTALGSVLAYTHQAVESLTTRPLLASADLEHAPRSVLVLRQSRGVDPRAAWSSAAVAARPLPLGRSARIWIDVRARHGSPTPCLVTVAGFVADGFDVTGAPSGNNMTHLQLQEAGSWFQEFRDRRLPTSRGREWAWWPPQPPDAHFTEVKRRTAVRKRPATHAG